MRSPPLTRRAFLQISGAGLGCGTLLLGCGNPERIHVFLSDQESRLFVALAEQIVPSDEFGPGATDAGVVFFIDRQLTSHYKRHQQAYRRGLAAVEVTSRAVFDRSFEALAWDEQTELLERLEQNDVPDGIWSDPLASGFFGMLRDHVMQGFYGGPQHGGNRHYMSYRMIGIDYPPVLGRHLPPTG